MRAFSQVQECRTGHGTWHQQACALASFSRSCPWAPDWQACLSDSRGQAGISRGFRACGCPIPGLPKPAHVPANQYRAANTTRNAADQPALIASTATGRKDGHRPTVKSTSVLRELEVASAISRARIRLVHDCAIGPGAARGHCRWWQGPVSLERYGRGHRDRPRSSEPRRVFSDG